MSVLQSRRAVVRAPLLGAVIAYAGTSAPTGWLFCFGQNVSRTTYAALFAVIGTTYGAGDGSTTFGMPDLRGRVPFGKDNMGGSAASRLTGAVTGGITGSGLGNAGGEQAHQITDPEMASESFVQGGVRINNSGATNLSTAAGSNNGAITLSWSFGGNATHNTVPPGIVLNYMIFAGV
jgi:microcystin-dependent protein